MVNRITLPVEKTEVLTLFPTFVWRTQLKAQDYEVIDRKIKQKLKELTAGNLKLEPGEKWQTDQCLHVDRIRGKDGHPAMGGQRRRDPIAPARPVFSWETTRRSSNANLWRLFRSILF